jgi:hypothetical protein
MKSLKILPVLLPSALAPLGWSAVVEAAPCIDQARAVAQRIQAEVVPNLNGEQLARIAAIAAELCSGEKGPPPAARTGAGAPEGYGDWFTYFMFEHSGHKPGNERLRHLKQ